MSVLAVVDDMIGCQAYAVNLIAYPSEQTKVRLSLLQDSITKGMPADTLYQCPAYSLHMSVFQFVHSRKSNSPDQVSLWNRHYQKIDKDLRSLTSASGAFLLDSPSIEVSESAVIIRFRSCPGMELLRDHLESSVKNNELAWNRPTIQHITILRYTYPFQLNGLEDRINQIELPDLSWNIESLDLVEESTYPSLDNRLVQNYKLGGRE